MKHPARDALLFVLSLAGWVALMLSLVHCAPPRTEADIAACMTRADAAVMPEVLVECQGRSFKLCPAHDRLMAKWRALAEACDE